MDRLGIARKGTVSPRSWLARTTLSFVLGAALLATLPGCQIVIGVLALFQGFPKQDCDFKKQTGKPFAEKGKKVLILSTSSAPAQSEHPSLDMDIISELSRRLRAQNIELIDSGKIAKYIDDNGGVSDETDLGSMGAKFDADLIVLVKFDEFSFREPNSLQLYRGKARGTIVVIEVQKGKSKGKATARKIYYRPFDSKFPLHAPIPAESERPDLFKQRYLARLSEELARLFYDHRPGEDM
jgi:hypothetical protein